MNAKNVTLRNTAIVLGAVAAGTTFAIIADACANLIRICLAKKKSAHVEKISGSKNEGIPQTEPPRCPLACLRGFGGEYQICDGEYCRRACSTDLKDCDILWGGSSHPLLMNSLGKYAIHNLGQRNPKRTTLRYELRDCFNPTDTDWAVGLLWNSIPAFIQSLEGVHRRDYLAEKVKMFIGFFVVELCGGVDIDEFDNFHEFIDGFSQNIIHSYGKNCELANKIGLVSRPIGFFYRKTWEWCNYLANWKQIRKVRIELRKTVEKVHKVVRSGSSKREFVMKSLYMKYSAEEMTDIVSGIIFGAFAPLLNTSMQFLKHYASPQASEVRRKLTDECLKQFEMIHTSRPNWHGKLPLPLSATQIGDMSYLRKVVCEAFRVGPGINTIRMVCRKSKQFGDITIPESSIINVTCSAYHWQPWSGIPYSDDAPLSGFHPERFEGICPPLLLPGSASEVSVKQSEYTDKKLSPFYQPFGVSLRSCVASKFSELFISCLAVSVAMLHDLEETGEEMVEDSLLPIYTFKRSTRADVFFGRSN